MPEIYQPLKSLLVNSTQRFATCWEITRPDGLVLRFTDHDMALTVDGDVYSPGGSFQASAKQSKVGTDAQSLDIRGALTSDAITEEDLKAGLFNQSSIVEFVVDWKFPFAGKFDTRNYLIEDVTFTSEVWTAKLSGIMIRLGPKVGSLYERKCRWKKFGDADCGLSLATITQSGVEVNSVSSSKLAFDTVNITPQEDDYYNDGVVTWTVGDNAGLKSEVKSWVQATGVLTLHIPTPFAIVAGDEFSIHKGCNRLFETCKDFANSVNFGGFPDIPTNDKLFKSPNAKAQ